MRGHRERDILDWHTGVVWISIRDEILVKHRVVEGVVARIEHDGLFAAPGIDAHPRRDFLPVGDLAQVRLAEPLANRVRRHGRGRLFGFPVRLRDGLQRGGIQQLDPEFPEQNPGPVGVGRVDLAIDREGVAHGVGLFLDDLRQGRPILLLPLQQILVLDGELVARRRGGRVERFAEALAQLLLRLGDIVPDLALALAHLRGHAQRLAGEIGFRAGLLGGPAVPAAALDAERRNRHPPGFRRQDKIHAEGAILPPALHHVAGLDVEIEMLGEILDFELPDVAGLVDRDAFLLQRIVEWDEALAVEGVGSEEQEDAEVFVGVGAGDGEVLGIHASILPWGSDIRGPTAKNKPRTPDPRRNMMPPPHWRPSPFYA